MLCSNPYNTQGMLFPCGQCMPCRLNKRRIWTHRLMLESNLHPVNAFLTLTYTDETLPFNSQGFATLNPKHLQDWLKRLRKRIEPVRIRFFAVGEYGDDTERPHYHVALFNYPPCSYGNSRYSKRISSCCSSCDVILDTWGHGLIFGGDLSINSAQYISGYVTKKMTAKDDYRLNGRHPEFSRQSNRPGIGADAMHDVASTVLQFDLVASQGDVPSTLRHGTRTLPLGRYLTRKLRKLVGEDEKAPDHVLEKIKEELQPLRQAAFDNSASFKKEFVKSKAQAILNVETRAKLRKKRGTL